MIGAQGSHESILGCFRYTMFIVDLEIVSSRRQNIFLLVYFIAYFTFIGLVWFFETGSLSVAKTGLKLLPTVSVSGRSQHTQLSSRFSFQEIVSIRQDVVMAC